MRHLLQHRSILGISLMIMGLGVGGCVADVPDGEPASGDDELRGLSLTLGDGLSLSDSPALKEGAHGALACGDRFDHGDRSRITCTRDHELLELVSDKVAKTSVIVYRPEGRVNDHRTFYA